MGDYGKEERASALQLDVGGDVGGEWIEKPARGNSVEDFVDTQIGLEVMQAFGKKSGGRRKTLPPLHFEMVRDLTIDDALVMQAAPPRQAGSGAQGAPLQRIRTIHHQIARMLADGNKIVNISAILGVTPARVQQLKNDPAFGELLAHYEEIEEQASIDLKHRFYLLGAAGMEELQERLLEEPDSFGNGHLMELVKLTIGGEAPKSNSAPANTQGLSSTDLERMKQNADAGSRGKITYRKTEEVDGQAKADKGTEVGSYSGPKSVPRAEEPQGESGSGDLFPE